MRCPLLPLFVLLLALLAFLIVAEQQDQQLVLDQHKEQLDHGQLLLDRSQVQLKQVEEMMMDYACRTIALCKPGGKEICKYVNNGRCEREGIHAALMCENEYKLCANGDSKNCAEVIEYLETRTTCDQLGITKRCETRSKSKVCAKQEPNLCMEVEKLTQESCTNEGSNKRLCEMKDSTSAKMVGTEKQCTGLAERRQECSVNEDEKKKKCTEKCANANEGLKELCTQQCSLSAEVCTDLQENKH